MDKKEQGFLDSYFQYSKYGSDFKTEIIAGITIFITLAYILIVNPQIISAPYLINGQPEMAQKIYNGVFIATCLGGFIGTFLCAIYAKMPFAQAPGMGLNAFFAYNVVLGLGHTYEQALVIVFLSGILFIIISALGIREAIVRAIPEAVKGAITPGIGLFIAMIGFQSAGIVVANDATLVSMIDFSTWMQGGEAALAVKGALVALIGLIVIVVLNHRNVTGSILIGIIVSTLVGIPLGITKLTSFSLNLSQQFSDFAEVSLFNLDFAGLFASGNFLSDLFTVIMLVISFSLVNMFDSMGTLIGASRRSGLVDESNDPINMRQLMMSDAISTAVGALLGTSTVTTLVESSAGIEEGGRSGLTSLTTAILLLAAIVLAPIVTIIPAQATAPALIMVGISMLGSIQNLDFRDMTVALPAFLTIVMMPFTYSIANGIAFGLISYCLVKIFVGEGKDIHPITAIVSIIFILRYVLMAA